MAELQAQDPQGYKNLVRTLGPVSCRATDCSACDDSAPDD